MWVSQQVAAGCSVTRGEHLFDLAAHASRCFTLRCEIDRVNGEPLLSIPKCPLEGRVPLGGRPEVRISECMHTRTALDQTVNDALTLPECRGPDSGEGPVALF